ncbi:MAG: Abi family protein [Candidatus Azobacteroides sp.]|nr:Abi family protein [Candidatus Azobacteroides sp.]
MKENYSKTCTLPKDLVPLLKQRGLTISNEQKAISYLTNIGYFRLSAYFYPLLKEPKTEHLYKNGATFDKAMDMYRFDRKLRMLIFNEIEKIEVAIRSAMNNLISDELKDVFWATNPQYFRSPAIFAKTLSLIQTETAKNKEDFIAHFQSKYSNPYPPVWMITEIIPLGVLINLCNNLANKSLLKKVAHQFGLPLPVFSSWTVLLVNLRNICGHHARLWNREIPFTSHKLNNPKFAWINSDNTDMKRVYFRICIIKYLLFTVSPNNRFTQKLKTLLSEYPTVDIRAMGFPADWENEPLWKINLTDNKGQK